MSPFATPAETLERSVRIEAVAKPHSSGRESAEVPQIYQVTLSSAPSGWYGAALNRISQLTELAAGWNSYASREVQADMAMETVRFLATVAYPGIAAPAIIPLADGGLQVEWHRGGLDVEITFSDEGSGVFIVDRKAEREFELPIAEAQSAVMGLLPRLREK